MLLMALGSRMAKAMACGTPCVAFTIGGMKDMITHRENGYLAKAFEVDELAQGILWLLDSPERLEASKNKARQKAVQAYALPIQDKRYLSLYEELAASRRQ